MLPRIGLSRTGYGGISLQSLYSLQLAPQISQNWWRLPLFYDVLNATGGGPPWASGEAPSQGVRPCAVAQGASHPAFLGGWWGHFVPNPQKSYLRLVWHQHVACAEKKKTEKMAKQSFQPSLTEFLQGPYLQTGMRTPFFFAFIAKSTSNSTQKCEKKISHFLDPPPEKKIFPAMSSSKSPKLRSFLYSSHKRC